MGGRAADCRRLDDRTIARHLCVFAKGMETEKIMEFGLFAARYIGDCIAFDSCKSAELRTQWKRNARPNETDVQLA